MGRIRHVPGILAATDMAQAQGYTCSYVPCLGAKMVVFHIKATSATFLDGYSLAYSMDGAVNLPSQALTLETRGTVTLDARNGTLLCAYAEEGLPIPAAAVALTLNSNVSTTGPTGVVVDAYVIWDETGLSVTQPFWQHHD